MRSICKFQIWRNGELFRLEKGKSQAGPSRAAASRIRVPKRRGNCWNFPRDTQMRFVSRSLAGTPGIRCFCRAQRCGTEKPARAGARTRLKDFLNLLPLPRVQCAVADVGVSLDMDTPEDYKQLKVST
jgi:hypothetical protein